MVAVGTYVKPLLKQAKTVTKNLGAIKVDMGESQLAMIAGSG
jgi:hypothetical protein